MPSFSYTSGDISHLTSSGSASMADIQGPFTDVRTALNGQLDEVNVPNLSAAFTTWKSIGWAGSSVNNTFAAGTYLIHPTSDVSSTVVGVAVAGTAGLAFYLDPSDYLANSRTTKYRIRWVCITNGTAPAANFTPGLYPVATFGAPAATSPTIATLGTVVSGSTVVFTAPALGTQTVTLSTEFNAPAAGHFAFGVVTSATPAANSQTMLLAQLQMRQV